MITLAATSYAIGVVALLIVVQAIDAARLQ